MKAIYTLLIIAIVAGGGYWYYQRHKKTTAQPATASQGSDSVAATMPSTISATPGSASTNVSVNSSSQNSKTDINVSSNSSNNSTSNPAATGSHVVAISNFAFSPQTITVKAGETVTFVNNDSVEHSVTADNGTFDLSFSNGKATIAMSNPGTYTYHCKIHPSMTGTIIWQ